MSKRCPKCTINKDRTEFGLRAGTSRLKAYCKACSSAITKKHYETNKAKHLHNVKQRTIKVRKQAQQFIIEYLLTHPCVDCGENNILFLDFDHLGNKTKGVCDMAKNGYSLDKIKAEINKCQVLCRNCHSFKTHKERNTYRYLAYINASSRIRTKPA